MFGTTYGLTEKGREEAENASIAGDLEHDIAATLLNGPKTASAIASQLDENYYAHDIGVAVAKLVKQGWITIGRGASVTREWEE